MTRYTPTALMLLGIFLFGFWPHPVAIGVGFALICVAVWKHP